MRRVKAVAPEPALPLYRQVQDGIEAMIKAKGGAARIPLSDTYLAERFGVSRITVRRAVNELVDAGLLYRIRGLGTFVRPRKLEEKVTLNSFLDGWTSKHDRFEVRIGAFERIPATPDVAERLRVEEKSEVVYVRRLRYQKETLVAVDDRYMSSALCRRLTRQDIVTASLVDYLRNREQVNLSHGEMEIEARRAERADAIALGIRQGQAVLVRRVVFLTSDGIPALAGVSTYRADRVSYRLTIRA
jgi:GntR family transcriptional regulator